MNKRKIIGIALIVFIFIGLSITVAYIFNELKNEHDIEIQNIETTDAKKFKAEYESINGQEIKEGIVARSVSIDDNNPIRYAKASDIVSKMDNNESFVVYFGFDTCPWCRSIIESLINTAKDNNVSTIYYVDVKNIRDVYSLNDKNEAVRTTEGTEGYYELLKRLDSVLDDYSPLTYDKKIKKKKVTVEVPVNEKRIYAPNIVLVREGKPVVMTTGISDELTDPYMELTDSIKNYTKESFDKLFKQFNQSTTTTNSYVCTGESNC